MIVNGIKMGVTTHIMDQNLSFIHDYRIGLILAPDISTWTFISSRVFFWHGYFSALRTFRQMDFMSPRTSGMGMLQHCTGTFQHRYISVQCWNVLVPKRPYCCAWCRNILVLKRTHAVKSSAEKSPCQKVPVPKCPRAKKSMCQKIPEWKSPLAEMSMETKCSYAVTSTEPKSPFCQNVPMTKCPCWNLSSQNVRCWNKIKPIIFSIFSREGDK